MSITLDILNKIKEYNKIMIHGHIRPDGDCYGSQFGLKDIIKTSFPEKEVYVVGETCNYVSFYLPYYCLWFRSCCGTTLSLFFYIINIW